MCQYHNHVERQRRGRCENRNFLPIDVDSAAGRLGLEDRGTIRPGAWADLAVFDGQTFRERGTVAAPNLTAQGMVHVLVNVLTFMPPVTHSPASRSLQGATETKRRAAGYFRETS